MAPGRWFPANSGKSSSSVKTREAGPPGAASKRRAKCARVTNGYARCVRDGCLRGWALRPRKGDARCGAPEVWRPRCDRGMDSVKPARKGWKVVEGLVLPFEAKATRREPSRSKPPRVSEINKQLRDASRIHLCTGIGVQSQPPGVRRLAWYRCALCVWQRARGIPLVITDL